MGRRIGLAVAGLGHLGRFHAANLAGRVPGAQLVHVVDANETVARSLGRQLDVAASTSYEALLADDRVAGVVIATPTSSHGEMVEQAAAAGKHVFVEKPLSLDVPSGRRAAAAVAGAGVQLQVGFHRRFDRDFERVASRVRAGELGEVRLFRSSHRDTVAPADTAYLRSGGDFFVDALIHDFDCARWIVGEIVEVATTGASLASPIFAQAGDVDNAVVTLRFASGAIGVVDGSRAAGYGYESSAEILGSEATARVAGNGRTNVEWLTPGARGRDCVEDFRERYDAAYLRELAEFARVVRGECEPAVGAEEAIAAFRVADAAGRSYREGGVVALPGARS